MDCGHDQNIGVGDDPHGQGDMVCWNILRSIFHNMHEYRVFPQQIEKSYPNEVVTHWIAIAIFSGHYICISHVLTSSDPVVQWFFQAAKPLTRRVAHLRRLNQTRAVVSLKTQSFHGILTFVVRMRCQCCDPARWWIHNDTKKHWYTLNTKTVIPPNGGKGLTHISIPTNLEFIAWIP